MIGMSLSYQRLLAFEDEHLNSDVLLPKLWEHDVRSIELRSVGPSASAVDVRRVADLLWDHGFVISIHGVALSLENAVHNVFAPLAELLGNMRQRELIVTLHPIADDNVAMLCALSDYIIQHNLPVRIALENNRKMPDSTEGDSAALVLDAVRRTNRKNVGICFDMGHFAWYAETIAKNPELLPPADFLSRVIHTHIHAYSEGTTHFPLEKWREPLSSYIDALGETFMGTYNIELEPERFLHRFSATEGYLCSADMLAAHYPRNAHYYDDLRAHYDEIVKHSLSLFDSKRGCFGMLLAPSAYLCSINGYRFAMDVSFLHLQSLAQLPSRVRECLPRIDCMLLTHGHADHFEDQTIAALADTDIQWVAPDFLLERLLKLGVPQERITSVRAGDDVHIGPLHIRVLEGKHFRPDTHKGIETVGYWIKGENAPSLVFPSDVRDYSISKTTISHADYCFAHVWLGDDALTPERYLSKSREFAEYMLSLSTQNIFLAHLYSYRHNRQRWTEDHAYIVEASIHEQSPKTAVHIPRLGEMFDLV